MIIPYRGYDCESYYAIALLGICMRFGKYSVFRYIRKDIVYHKQIHPIISFKNQTGWATFRVQLEHYSMLESVGNLSLWEVLMNAFWFLPFSLYFLLSKNVVLLQLKKVTKLLKNDYCVNICVLFMHLFFERNMVNFLSCVIQKYGE